MKRILSIELPTCEPDTFKKYWLDNFKAFAKIKDIITFNINFQNFSDEEITYYIDYIQSLGIEVNYIKSEYIKGRSLIDLREETHQINPYLKYNLIVDDDIHITDADEYIRSLLLCLDKMDADPSIGIFCFERLTIKFSRVLLYEYRYNSHGTDGGHLVRGRKDHRLFDEKYKGLLGAGQDRLLCFQSILECGQMWCCRTKGYSHYDIREVEGKDEHAWGECKQEVEEVIKELTETVEATIRQNVDNMTNVIIE